MNPDVGGTELLAGRYRVGPLLGQGGMAGVYDGYDTRLARPVAIKLLRPEIGAQPAMRLRFEQEARSAAGLSHPNAVSVYDSGEDRGQAFLIMERLPGRTLADAIALGPMDQGQVVSISSDVLAALAAAHGVGMVHRDIKPGNILLTDDGRAKVADFGIAKSLEAAGSGDGRPDLTMAGLVIGTPAYLAPERLAGAAATPQSDLYAMGVVMYEALTGRKPVEGANLIEVARARQTPPPDIAAVRPDVAGWLAAVVRRSTAAAAEARYRSALDMLSDLRAGGTGRRLPPPPAGSAVGRGGTQILPAGAMAAAGVAPPPTRMDRPGGAVAASRADYPGAGQGAGYGGGQAASWGAQGPVGPPPPQSRGPRRGWIAAVVLLLLLVIAVIVAIVLVAQHNSSGPTSTSSTTATSTTVDSVAQQLDQVASQLSSDGGFGPRAAAAVLQGVATVPAGSARTQAANRASTQIQRLFTGGEINESQYNEAIGVLSSAGAATPTTTTTTTTTTTPTTTSSTTTTTTTPTTTTAPTTTTTTPTTTSTATSTTTTGATTTTAAQGQGQGQGQGQ